MVFYLYAPEIFSLSNDKSNNKKNIGKYFWTKSSSAHVPTVLTDLAISCGKRYFISN